MQGEAAVAAARGHAHVSSGPVPHGMQAPPISFHSANTDGVQPPRTTNLVTSTIEVQRRCFPASLRMPPTSTMVVLATSRMFGHCMGAAIVLDPLPTRRDRGRQAACTAQTPMLGDAQWNAITHVPQRPSQPAALKGHAGEPMGHTDAECALAQGAGWSARSDATGLCFSKDAQPGSNTCIHTRAHTHVHTCGHVRTSACRRHPGAVTPSIALEP